MRHNYQKEEIRNFILANREKPYVQIARELGRSKQYVGQIARELGLPYRGKNRVNAPEGLIGEIRLGHELGYTGGKYNKWIFRSCGFCGVKGWVPLESYNQGEYRNCRICALKETNRKRRGNIGPKAPYWKGGRVRHPSGYIHIYVTPDNFFYAMAMKKCNRRCGTITAYILEHRFIMAQYLGRCLQSWEWVHHKNGIKDDNRLENLELSTRSAHITDHNMGYRDGYQQGYQDGMNSKIRELEKYIKLLFWVVQRREKNEVTEV